MGQVHGEAVTLRAERLTLRPLRPDEIDRQWRTMLEADPVSVSRLPDELAFRARLARSGHLVDRWIDLAIDVGGAAVGRIQTFVPPDREDRPEVFNIGITLDPEVRGQGYAAEALAVFTAWLLDVVGAQAIEGRTDPANVAMQRVFAHLHWTRAGQVVEHDREWLLFHAPRTISARAW